MRPRPLTLALSLGAAAMLVPASIASAAGSTANLSYGSTVEYPSGPGQAMGALASGPDGNVWFAYQAFTPPASAGLSAMATGTQQIVGTFAMPASLFPLPYRDASSLTSGPDGRLWFLQAEGPNATALLGAVTTSGAYSAYPLPAGSTGGGITVSGNTMWVAVGGSLLQVGTTGQVTQFPMPVGTTNASKPVVGPDGSVWFSAQQAGGSVLGRLLNGQIAFTAVPAPRGIPANSSWYIAAMGAGPTGSPWAQVQSVGVVSSLPGPGAVMSVGTNGSMTQVATLPSTTCDLACNLVQMQDGNAWLASGNALLRVTPGGTVTSYTVVSRRGNAEPSGPVSGPDRNLWFVDTVSGNLGTLAMPGGANIPAPATSMINGYSGVVANRGKRLTVTFEAGQSAAGKSTITITRSGRTVTLWSGNVRPGTTRAVSGTVPSSFPRGTATVSLRTPKAAGRAATTVTVK